MEGELRAVRDDLPPLGQPVRFTGSAKEYFGIWIVNVLLTVATLGIWSAWAKVRRVRYFNGHTHVLGASLDYLASPWTILKGRLLVVFVLALYSLLQYFAPVASTGVAGVYIILLPWIICRSLRFNARNTVWRDVRFDFVGTWKRAILVYVVFPLLSVLSLGTLAPWSSRAAARFWADNHRLGTAPFQTKTKVSSFYAAMGWSIVAFVGILLLIGLLVWGLARGPIRGLYLEQGMNFLPLLLIFVILPSSMIATAMYRAQVRNIVVNRLFLEGGHRFRSTLRPSRYVWIMVSNLVVTLLTLGLARPWAAVRHWRYLAETLEVIPGEDPESLVDAQVEAGGAFGSEFTALDSLDLGL